MNGVPDPVRGYTTWQKLEFGLQPGAEQSQYPEQILPKLELPPLVAIAAEAVKMADRESSHSPPSEMSQIQIPQSSSSLPFNAVARYITPGSPFDGQQPPTPLSITDHLAVANYFSDVAEFRDIPQVKTYDQENTIWECFEQCIECHENCDLGLRLRLICKNARDVGSGEDVEVEISSTSLYRIITESSGKDRRERLQNQVLSLDLLCEYLQRTGFDYVRLAAPFSSKNHEEEQNDFYEAAWRSHLAGEDSSEARAHADELGESKQAAVQEDESTWSLGPVS